MVVKHAATPTEAFKVEGAVLATEEATTVEVGLVVAGAEALAAGDTVAGDDDEGDEGKEHGLPETASTSARVRNPPGLMPDLGDPRRLGSGLPEPPSRWRFSRDRAEKRRQRDRGPNLGTRLRAVARIGRPGDGRKPERPIRDPLPEKQ